MEKVHIGSDRPISECQTPRNEIILVAGKGHSSIVAAGQKEILMNKGQVKFNGWVVKL